MFAVIFEVEPKPERRAEYLELAGLLKPALEKIDGFLEVERFASLYNKDRVLSLSLWRDEKAVIRWRTLGAHHHVQARGRSEVFRDYHLRVGEITFDTNPPAGATLARHRLDETETGSAKFVTISEVQQAPADANGDILGAFGLPEPGSVGLVGRELFESIYNPGKLSLLASWRDEAAAASWKPRVVTGTNMRHRCVRVIRDYGMFDRREAPQYYPPAPDRDPS